MCYIRYVAYNQYMRYIRDVAIISVDTICVHNGLYLACWRIRHRHISFTLHHIVLPTLYT